MTQDILFLGIEEDDDLYQQLVERIQYLETQALLAKYELYKLKEKYKKQLKTDESVNNLKKFAEEHNRKLKEAGAND